jgi:hypothetical protein
VQVFLLVRLFARRGVRTALSHLLTYYDLVTASLLAVVLVYDIVLNIRVHEVRWWRVHACMSLSLSLCLGLSLSLSLSLSLTHTLSLSLSLSLCFCSRV